MYVQPKSRLPPVISCENKISEFKMKRTDFLGPNFSFSSSHCTEKEDVHYQLSILNSQPERKVWSRIDQAVLNKHLEFELFYCSLSRCVCKYFT